MVKLRQDYCKIIKMNKNFVEMQPNIHIKIIKEYMRIIKICACGKPI